MVRQAKARLAKVTQEAVEILRFVLKSSSDVTLPPQFIEKVLNVDYFAMVRCGSCTGPALSARHEVSLPRRLSDCLLVW